MYLPDVLASCEKSLMNRIVRLIVLWSHVAERINELIIKQHVVCVFSTLVAVCVHYHAQTQHFHLVYHAIRNG